MKVTVFSRSDKPKGYRRDVTWSALVRSFERPVPGVAKTDLPGWSPAIFRRDWRNAENVEEVCLVVLDYDAGVITLERAADYWRHGAGFIHTTSSHTAEKHKFRVVLTMTRPVSAFEYTGLRSVIADILHRSGHVVDRGASDASRFWYAPADLPNYSLQMLTGRPINVDRLLAHYEPPKPQEGPVLTPQLIAVREQRALAYIAKCPPAVSGEGGHERTFCVAEKIARGFAYMDGDEAMAFLRLYNETCIPSWSEKELKHKLRSAVRYGRKPIGYML